MTRNIRQLGNVFSFFHQNLICRDGNNAASAMKYYRYSGWYFIISFRHLIMRNMHCSCKARFKFPIVCINFNDYETFIIMLLHIFKRLLGFQPAKPFSCVINCILVIRHSTHPHIPYHCFVIFIIRIAPLSGNLKLTGIDIFQIHHTRIKHIAAPIQRSFKTVIIPCPQNITT